MPTGYVEGDTIGLNLDTSLFVGGVPKLVRLPQALNIDTGFNGCISQVL